MPHAWTSTVNRTFASPFVLYSMISAPVKREERLVTVVSRLPRRIANREVALLIGRSVHSDEHFGDPRRGGRPVARIAFPLMLSPCLPIIYARHAVLAKTRQTSRGAADCLRGSTCKAVRSPKRGQPDALRRIMPYPSRNAAPRQLAQYQYRAHLQPVRALTWHVPCYYGDQRNKRCRLLKPVPKGQVPPPL